MGVVPNLTENRLKYHAVCLKVYRLRVINMAVPWVNYTLRKVKPLDDQAWSVIFYDTAAFVNKALLTVIWLMSCYK